MTPAVGPAPISPPWSTITAYDLNKGTIKWQVPLGEVPELVEKGITNTGSGAPRGAVVTAGGLMFSGTPDNTFRAFDKDTGRQLWEKKLPSNPMGVAATYEIGGRQYVVSSASPSRRAVTPEGAQAPQAAQGLEEQEDASYFVFALPERVKTSTADFKARRP